MEIIFIRDKINKTIILSLTELVKMASNDYFLLNAQTQEI